MALRDSANESMVVPSFRDQGGNQGRLHTPGIRENELVAPDDARVDRF